MTPSALAVRLPSGPTCVPAVCALVAVWCEACAPATGVSAMAARTPSGPTSFLLNMVMTFCE